MTAATHNAVRRTVLVAIVVMGATLGLVVSAARGGDRGTASATGSADGALIAPADPAPLSDTRFVTFDGRTTSLADLRGKPVVVNFWASWCPACIAEMPDFERVHRAFADEVTFVGIAIQDEREAADRLAERTGVTYLLVEDPAGDFFRAYDGISMPTTVFIDARGELVDKHSGVLTEDDLRDAVESLVSGPA